ncbi:cytochrome P450 716B1-like [Fagus crenata]
MSIFLAIFLFLIPIFLLLTKGRRSLKRLPPGSLGIPMIGQSLGLLRAMHANTAEQWLKQRIKKYGPISKLSLFGKPTVFIYGQAANKFKQSFRAILGEKSIMELSGEDHKRVRGALLSFLKPESLKQYVGKMDEEVKKHLEMHWQGKKQVKVRTLILLPRDDIIWSIPIDLPFTRYNRSLKASTRVQNMVRDLIREKRVELEQKGASPCQDLITCMLSIHNENNEQVISDKEIVQNVIVVMVAGHDTSSVLITFIIRLLANEPAVYAAILQEFLTWEDLAKMKYTWRVAMETLRIHPPVFWVSPMTHMDSSILPEPSKFDPTGPRICPGNEFARIETLVTIHYLITHFTSKLCADNSFSRDPTPVPTQGLPIQLVQKKTF